MKTCSKCKIEKNKSEFYKDNRAPDKLTRKCKECAKEDERKYYNKDIEKRRFKAKLKRFPKESFTLEKFNTMLAEQQNNCAICILPMNPPCVDHNHSTGKIRMLLCHKCNTMIGLAKENKNILKRAIEYIDKFES